MVVYGTDTNNQRTIHKLFMHVQCNTQAVCQVILPISFVAPQNWLVRYNKGYGITYIADHALYYKVLWNTLYNAKHCLPDLVAIMIHQATNDIDLARIQSWIYKTTQ